MRWTVPTLGNFLRKIAIDYARFGYTRYVMREIPEGKDVGVIDAKLIAHYRVTSCRTTRQRRRQQGIANVQYLRWGHTLILLATEGRHPEFERLCDRDLTTTPLHIKDYSIGFRGELVSVELTRHTLKRVERDVLPKALTTTALLEKAINALPFYRFPGVISQLWNLCTALNARRKAAGLPQISLQLPSPSRYRKSS